MIFDVVGFLMAYSESSFCVFPRPSVMSVESSVCIFFLVRPFASQLCDGCHFFKNSFCSSCFSSYPNAMLEVMKLNRSTGGTFNIGVP